MNFENRTSPKKTPGRIGRTNAGSNDPLWRENPAVAEFERRFYQESVDAMIRIERPSIWLHRMIAGLRSFFRWRPTVPTTSVNLGQVIRDLETPVQDLASCCSEHRRRRSEA
jgi:hypothetical protein